MPRLQPPKPSNRQTGTGHRARWEGRHTHTLDIYRLSHQLNQTTAPQAGHIKRCCGDMGSSTLSLCLSVSLPVCLSLCMSLYLSLSLSVYLCAVVSLVLVAGIVTRHGVHVVAVDVEAGLVVLESKEDVLTTTIIHANTT